MPLFARINFINVFMLLLGLNSAFADSNNGRKPWIGFSSGLTVSGQYYRNWGGDPRQQPFMYSISGVPALDIKGMTMPFNVLYSNQVFTVQQPFNQIGIAPRFNIRKHRLGIYFFSSYKCMDLRFYLRQC